MTDSTPITFPALPGVLRRCSPVIVHNDGTRPHGLPAAEPEDFRGVIASDEWTGDTSEDPETGEKHPVGGWLVALNDGVRTMEWSAEIPSWTLSLDLSDPTGVDHLRDWLARTTLKGRRTQPIGSVWSYDAWARCWRLRVHVGKQVGYSVYVFGSRGTNLDYGVLGLTAKLKPAEALRLCALHIAGEKGLLP